MATTKELQRSLYSRIMRLVLLHGRYEARLGRTTHATRFTHDEKMAIWRHCSNRSNRIHRCLCELVLKLTGGA